MFNQPINQEVSVTALYFSGRNQRGGKLKTFPKRMEWQGDTYTFRDGLQYLIKKGLAITQIFDMTDGETNYRLQADPDGTRWTLLAVSKA